jgi:septin family protein
LFRPTAKGEFVLAVFGRLPVSNRTDFFSSSLRDIDIEFLKRMGEISNVIPVIAKADTLTQKEMTEFKAQMNQDLQSNGIKIYPNSYCEDVEVVSDLVVGF